MKQANYLDRIGEPFVVNRPYYCTGCGQRPTEQFDVHYSKCPGEGPTAIYGKDFEPDFEPFRPGDAFCAEVAQRIELIKPEWKCYGEFNQCVSVYPGGTGDNRIAFWFGTANNTWGADVYENVKAQEDGVIKTSLDTGVSQREGEQNVAEAIVRTVERYVASLKFLEAMAAFHQAANDLSLAWEKLHKDDSANKRLVASYPFQDSFDEIPLAITDWWAEVANDPAFGKVVKEVK